MKEKLGGIFDGFILLAIGGFAGYLIFSGNYWYYINPKFEWLTGLTAAVLLVAGMVSVIKPKRRVNISRIMIFLVLIAVLAVVAYSGKPRATQSQPDVSAESDPAESAPEEKSRVTLGGDEYIRINLAELVWIAEKQIPEKLGLHYVVRGIVKRSERLDDLGYFAVVRNVITCCLADSMGLGLPVKYSRMRDFPDGQWVVIYGVLEHLDQKVPREGLRPGGMRLITLSHTYALVPTKIVEIEKPDSPYIFDARDGEPYAY